MAFDFTEKHTPYFSSLVSLSFTTNNICKNVIFFLATSFPNKAFVFLSNRMSEGRICRQGWFRKTSTFACVISQKRKGKNERQCRTVKSKVTCKKLAHLEAKKKNVLKSHLRCLCRRLFNYRNTIMLPVDQNKFQAPNSLYLSTCVHVGSCTTRFFCVLYIPDVTISYVTRLVAEFVVTNQSGCLEPEV